MPYAKAVQIYSTEVSQIIIEATCLMAWHAMAYSLLLSNYQGFSIWR